ncbi:uncharacterized protein V6R79_021014 [Siganus canaliculatus]
MISDHLVWYLQHHPMSKLITSTQDCNYQFDNRGKHITAAMCTEKHIYLPFSNEDNGISSVVTQELNFQSSKKINNRLFDVDHSHSVPLHFEDPDDKSPVQTKDTVLSTMQDLLALPGTDQGQMRPSLFHKLVSTLRVLRNETLSETVTEMSGMSSWVTWQALLQCGTPECTSAILQVIRTIDGVSLEVDALVYGLSLQSNPDAARVRDMLSMAQYKQSKAIMYALANTVKKFHKGEVTPVVTDVSKFMETLLNDCSGEIPEYDSDTPPDPEELSFLVLRVVGVMGEAMQAVSPSLISSVLRCAQKGDIPLSNQKAAIQAFRLMDITDEIRNILTTVYQDAQSPVEKRIAAYLILMKKPDQVLLSDIVNNLENLKDEQLRSFVVSHLHNIRKSDKPEILQLKEYINLALNDQPTLTNNVFGTSRNYKINSALGSVQSNIIFDDSNTLPKEVMLETTLKVFDYNYDVLEVGIEGTGFEPTIDALFGEKGFFPDTISKVLYWAGDTAQMLRGVFDRMAPHRDRMKRQIPQDILKDITSNVQKLMDDIRFSSAPEATAYLRLLGNEIGYMKTSEMREMVRALFMYHHVFFRILPAQAFFALTSGTENKVFAHYIFMENAFALPTASGFPLKFSLAGVFAPGAKGGLTPSFSKTDLSFMPSVGLEFITQMGVYLPDYVEAGLEMHTNMYHESSLNAKLTMSSNQVKLSIPAPKSNTKLFSISNKILSVSSGKVTTVPSLVEDHTDTTDCQPLFTGLNFCTSVRYSNATSLEQALYNPLNGETRVAVEIQPTGKISEYTAILTEETLREGKKGRHKVESLKLILRAEGDDATEATAALKYNRNKNTLTTEVVIPDYDVEFGVKLAVIDSEAKGKRVPGITIDVTNKNIPQLTVVGRARLEMMRDAMLQLQMVVPSLKTDASFTATLNKDEDVLMNLETVINGPETSYQQKASLKYDNDKFELELASDLNSDIHQLIPNVEDHRRQLQQVIDNILDQRVAMTDMKYRHIVSKGIVAGNKWLEKLTARFPFLTNLRNKRSLSDLTLPELPEKLFLKTGSSLRYQFNKDRMAISIPLPHGGRKSEELNIPTTLSIPDIDLQAIGIYIPAKKFPLPSFTVPPSLDFTLPLLGLAEVSTKITSNLYSWEGSIAGGNNTVDVPSYIAQYKAMAQSPFSLLSYKIEGVGMMSGKADDNLKYLLNNSFSHGLIDTSFSVVEMLGITDKLHARANYKFEATSPLGLEASLYYSAQSTSTMNSDEVSGDGTLDGLLQIGSFNTNASYTHSYNLHPLDREGKGESTLQFNAPFIQVHNKIHGSYANSELKVVSKTNAQDDIFRHVAELKYKDAQLTLKSNAVAKAHDKSISNKVELGMSSRMAILRIETQADDDTNRAYSLLMGSLDSNGLEVNSEGSIIFNTGYRGLHKASLVIGRNGLTSSGTNSIQYNLATVENGFNCAIDSNGGTLSSMTKAIGEESRGELNIEGKVTATEASLYGVLKGHAYDATTGNNMKIIVNRRGLTFTGNTMATLNQMKSENAHTLTVTLWTLALRSKTNTGIGEDIYVKQDTKVDMKPFVMSVDLTNDLKVYDVSLNTEGHMKLQPVKVDLSGSMKGSYGEDCNMKNTYEFYYEDMSGSVKHSVSGNIRDTQLSHSCELEFAGLSSKANCETRINSEPLRFDSTVHTLALPFSITVDALVNSDGEIHLTGKHTGQLYSKLLVRAEPLSLAYSHDSRLSTAHALPNGEVSTNVDNQLVGLVTPTDQSLSWKVKSKLNDHAYDQDITTYNNPEKIGFEFSGVMLTDILSKMSRNKRSLPEIQEFSVTGVLQYDKSSDCHIIEIPIIKSFPATFEQFKNTLVQALESLQQSINNLDINQLIIDFRAKLDQLPMQVKEFMRELDLENKMNQVKAKLDYLIDEFAVTIDDLEVAVFNLRKKLEITVMDIATTMRDLILTVKSYVEDGKLTEKITHVLSQTGNQLQALDEKYGIKQSLIRVLDIFEDFIRRIDLQKLTESSVAWLQELDSKYLILDKIRDTLFEIKQAIENFDINGFSQDIKAYLLSIDFAMYIEQLSYKIPTSEIERAMETMNDIIVNWIDEYEIPHKLNTVYFYIRDQLLRYGLDDKFKELMDQIVILIKEFRIDETVQAVADVLKSIKFEFVHEKVMQFLDNVTNHLRAIDFKRGIDYLNECISSMLKALKEFDYSAFVNEVNRKIDQIVSYINEQIKTYEIVQKIEAVREFFREVQTSAYAYLEELKNTRVADALKKLNKVIDTTFYNDIRMKVKDMLEDVRQRILEMNIRDEMYLYLQRASESYSNIVAFISMQFNRLTEKIRSMERNNEIVSQLRQSIEGVLEAMRKAQIDVPTFVVPFTDLTIPAFTINLNRLQKISIPAQISVPEFTILNSYRIPELTIDFEEIKAKIVAFIDNIREFEIQMPDPDVIFGDLKILYLSDLPDFTLPEITLSEIKLPAISIPTLNLEEFKISTLPVPEIKLPDIPSDICIPVFGKLRGEFRLNSPQYTVITVGKIENSTTTSKNPQFTATISSHAKSSIQPLEYNFDATAQLEAPKMKKLLFTETVRVTHMAFSIDHEGSLSLTSNSAEASAKTVTKATTKMYTADFSNNMALSMQNGISASIDSTYNHNLNVPSIETLSQLSMKQNIAATMEYGRISITGENTGNGKWSIQDYSDEGTHKSSVDFNINFSTAKLTFEGETDCKTMKSKQTLAIESVILSHMTVEGRCETEAPFMKSSVMVVNGQAHIGDLKVVLTASHDAEFTGPLIGSVANSLDFGVHPFEIMLDAKNKVNSKIFLPLKLTGKIDLQHDVSVVLNSEKQYADWFALARFNQYKYNHKLTAENNDMHILFHSSANGEANLDFLTVPLSIPDMTIPYLEMKTPEVNDLSLWEHAGLKNILTTPQQSFEWNLKLQYHKNPDVHNIELQLEPIYTAISHNAEIIQAQFKHHRDKVVALLKSSYNQAKSQYIKHKIETSSLPPRIFTVPGYKIPILNIQVSSFSAEMPAFSYFVPKEVSTPSFKVPALGFSVPSYTLVLPSLELPVIHVPETLSEITLPAFTLPTIQNNIVIPAMGNMTCDFSFKSAVVTLNANAGLYNQSDIVARLSASSTSVFHILNGRMDSTTSLTRTRGLKLATTMSVEHNNVQANHECAVSLNKRSMDASVANTAKISLPFLNVEINQELSGNTKTKPNGVSKNKVKYMFNIPLIESVGKGIIDMNLALEALSSYVSVETTTQGKSDITIMDSYNVAGDLENEANFYVNINGLRTTVRTVLNSNIDKQEKQKRSSNNNIFSFDLNENMALEVSLRRMYATVDYTSNNNVDFASFKTNGKHIIKGELDFVPLTTLKSTLKADLSQPSSLGHAGLIQSISLSINSAKQSFTWSGKEQLASFIHTCEVLVSNDESEVRMDLIGSVEGHIAFLKSVKLPAYQKTLWDVLKFDQVTNMDDLQFLSISSNVVYTKSMDGQEYRLPSKLFENGVTFSIPQISIEVPSWAKEIPQSLGKIDMRFKNSDILDHINLPPVISVSAFNVPFTNLHVEPFTIDPKNLNIPSVITTAAFEIMLPGLPILSVPSYDIRTEYLQEKIQFLSFKVPQYEIAVSSFTVPKSFTVGGYTFSLNDITSHISNFELPTITIPEQNIEIPEMTLHLPSSVFIPAFGAISATMKVSSPIYNVSTTAMLEKKDSDLVISLNSICTSTMIFLEYDLLATATLGFDNGLFNLNGKCNFIHNDVNVDWQHILTRNPRMKRQTSSADSMESRHTLNIDVTSRTFSDMSFRFASLKDGVTASVSLPSAGFLGFHIQRRSSSQLYGKVFSRYLSSPEKDTEVFTAKATLRNSQKLIIQTSWNWEFLHDVIEGTKERIPAMTDSLLKFINKYHVAHFGFDLNRGGLKLKNTVSNAIERAYHEFPFSALQNSIKQLGDQGKDMYTKASDSLMSMRTQDVIDKLIHEAGRFVRYSKDNIYALLHEARELLTSTKFPVPGSEEKLSSKEMLQLAHQSVSRVTDRALERFETLMWKISRNIREIEFTIPGTAVVVNGNEILNKLKSSAGFVYDQLKVSLHKGLDLLHRIVNKFIQVIAEKGDNIILYLNNENVEIASQVDAIHTNILQSSKHHIEEVKRSWAECKDLTKQKIQEIFNDLNMEHLNNGTHELIDIFQSHLYGELNEGIDLMRRASQSTTPYIQVSNKKMDVEIPLPFLWKSFNEWPRRVRH